MKKLLAALVALVAINASAYDVTNTVTIVSNIYNRISEEHWITNNIKNTHTNYHYTNNVYTVSNVTLLVSQTNVHTTATYDMGRSMLSIMSNDVNSAKASIRSTADEAAGSASRASSSASWASSSASSAQNTLNNVNTRGAEIINGMNAKQAWFDQNYGKMITNHNIYVAEDQVARAGVAQNAADIASLEGRVGDNIQQLTTRMGAAETNIGNLNTSASNSFAYTTAVSNKLERGVADSFAYTTAVSNKLERGVANSFAYTTAVSNKLEHGIANATSIAKSASDKADYNNERITALNGTVSNVELKVRDNHRDITNSVNYTTAVSNKLEQSVLEANAYTTAVSNKLEQGVSEAKHGVRNSIEYTTGVSNKFEKMNRIYNDGTGYPMWMDKKPTIQTLRVYRSNYLLVTVTFDPSKYVDNVSGESFEYTDFTRTPTSLAPHVTPSDFRLYKMKSNNRFLMTDRYNVSSTSTMSYTIYWNAGSSDPADVGSGSGTSGSSGISGTSSKDVFKQTPYYVMSDLTIRKTDNTIIAKLATSIALNAISNWVEQTFQRK